MKLLKTVGEICFAILAMQWAYMLTMLGYEKWGIFGAALGLLSSVPLLPFAPFTAWLWFPVDQMWWFYGLGAVTLLCWGASALLTPSITSDYPHR